MGVGGGVGPGCRRALRVNGRLLGLPRSYKSFLPKGLRAQIERRGFLTRKRIRLRFKRFVERFGQFAASARDLKLKYLISMEALDKAFYTESFRVREPSGGARLVLLVAADTGVQWCRPAAKDSPQVGTPRCSSVVRCFATASLDFSHLVRARFESSAVKQFIPLFFFPL